MKKAKIHFVQDYGTAGKLLASIGILPDTTPQYQKYLQQVVKTLPEVGEYPYSRTNLDSKYYQLRRK